LTILRDNAARLQPLLDSSFLLKELIPVSQNLASLGAAGLQALDYIHKGDRASESWKSEQVAMIERMKTPKADVILVVAAAVQILVEAVQPRTRFVDPKQRVSLGCYQA
jgi:hypothetical protein